MSKFAWRAAARRSAAPFSAALVALVFLSACGGSGDGAPPPPTLSITSTTTSTSSAGSAVALHAAQAHSTSTPTWTLTGPGSLSATTGTDVTYIPPDGESLTQASTATVTVSADGLSSQIVISVAVGSVAGQHWDTAHAIMPSWRSVVFDAGIFVAVGSSGGVSVSTDGQQWTSHNTAYHNWASLAHGNAGWVAISFDGSVGTSTDGTEWSITSTALPGADVNTSLSEVVFGNGVYVIGSYASGSWVSTDGVSWTPIPYSFTAFAYGGGTLLGIQAGEPFVSTDGQQWTAEHANSLLGSVAYANGSFLAGSASYLLGSVDGITWTFSAVTPYDLDPVFSTGDAFYQSGSIGYNFNSNLYPPGTISTSASGQQWTYHSQSVVGVASGIAKGANSIVVVAHDGSIGSGADVDHLQTVVARSNDWFTAGDYVQGKYMALSIAGDLLSSADGHTWSNTLLSDAGWSDVPRPFSGSAMAHAASGRMVVSGLVPTTSNNVDIVLLYSDDGIAWHAAAMPPGMSANTIINDGTRFLAFSNDTVYASADGSTWSVLASIPEQNSQWITKAVYGHGLYAVVGYGGLVATSPDAVNWTVAPTVMDLSATPAPVNFGGVVHTGTRLVAVGANGYVATSADGQSWNVTTSATPQSLNAIAISTQGELVAVGDQGVAETSVDEVHWTLRSGPVGASLHDVIFANGNFMAVGQDSFIEMSSH